MSGYPGPGQYNNKAMNGGPKPQDSYQPLGQGYVRHDKDSSHYSKPYSDKQHQHDHLSNGISNNDIKNDTNINGNKMAIHRPRLNRKNAPEQKAKSHLTTNFDPMKDRHMWAMWRTAVNGRIVDQVRKNEQFKHDALLPPDEFSSTTGVTDAKTNPITYGKDLAKAPPLSRFIRLNQKSKHIAQELMNEGQGKLETTQFIYYGLPRVTVNTSNNNRYSNNNNSSYNNNDYYNNINGAQNGFNHNYSNMNFYSGDVGSPRVQSL